MYKELKFRLINSLKYEMDYIAKFEKDSNLKFEKLMQIKNIMLVLENYEEIEPEIAKIVNENAINKKWRKKDER